MNDGTYSEAERIEAIFQAAVDMRDCPAESLGFARRRLSDAIDAFGTHAFGDGYDQRIKDEKLDGSLVSAIENIWGLPPRSKHAA
jgi:hypothetical protein